MHGNGNRIESETSLTEIFRVNVPIFYGKLLKDLTIRFKLRSIIERPANPSCKEKIIEWASTVIEVTEHQFDGFEFPSKFFHLGKILFDHLTSGFLHNCGHNVSKL